MKAQNDFTGLCTCFYTQDFSIKRFSEGEGDKFTFICLYAHGLFMEFYMPAGLILYKSNFI